jgi:hypothetical protein
MWLQTVKAHHHKYQVLCMVVWSSPCSTSLWFVSQRFSYCHATSTLVFQMVYLQEVFPLKSCIVSLFVFFFISPCVPNNHIEQMVFKLSWACYAVRSVVHMSNINTLKSIYYAHVHSVVKYGIILGFFFSSSGKIFTLQKKIVMSMAGAQPRVSCRSLFKQLEIWPFPC